MALELEKEKFEKLYKYPDLEEFDEDYSNFKVISRLLISYYRAPDKKKIHSIYNKVVILRRVFPKTFIECEIIKIAPNMYTRNLIIFILNELFGTSCNIDIQDDCWMEDLDELMEEHLVKIM